MTVNSHHLIVWLIIGFIAGTLAGRVVTGGGFGCLANTVVGLAGALIGGLLLSWLSPNRPVDTFGVIGDIAVSFIGAALLLAILRLLTPRRAWRPPKRWR
ncbi:MAG: GlsB/YeaQ/YmgE family stress response membrane protein [Candidatus Dormibacter sp.]